MPWQALEAALCTRQACLCIVLTSVVQEVRAVTGVWLKTPKIRDAGVAVMVQAQHWCPGACAGVPYHRGCSVLRVMRVPCQWWQVLGPESNCVFVVRCPSVTRSALDFTQCLSCQRVTSSLAGF